MRFGSAFRVVAPLASLVLYIIFLIYINFQPLSIWGFKGQSNFGDLAIILDSSTCTWTKSAHSNCSDFIYGPFLLYLLKFTQTTSSDVITLTFVMFATYLITLGFLSKNWIAPRARILLFIPLFSPPLILLYERANLDLLIFSLVLMGLMLYVNNWKSVALLVLTLTVLFKMYTLPVFFILFLWEKSRFARQSILLISSVLSCYTAFVFFSNNSGRDFEAGSPFGAYGIKVIGNSLAQLTGVGLFRMLGIGILIFLSWACFGQVLKNKEYPRENGVDDSYNLIGFSFLAIFLLMYVTNMNYDYRLIFLVPAVLIPGILTLRFMVSYVIVFFFSINLGGLQIVGDIFMVVVIYDLLMVTIDRFWRRKIGKK
jgi:hypothetical protein